MKTNCDCGSGVSSEFFTLNMFFQYIYKIFLYILVYIYIISLEFSKPPPCLRLIRKGEGVVFFTSCTLALPKLVTVYSYTGWSFVPFYTWGGGGRAYSLLLGLVLRPLTTHPFQDGAPFLLLIETPPTCGRSLRCFYILRGKKLLPSCFAACGHLLYIS